MPAERYAGRGRNSNAESTAMGPGNAIEGGGGEVKIKEGVRSREDVR